MVFYIFLVAVLNMGLGFGVAIYLGWRYRAVATAGDPGTGDPGIGDAAFGQSAGGLLWGDEEPAAAKEPVSDQPPGQQSAEASVAATADPASGTPVFGSNGGLEPNEVFQPQSPPTSQQEKSPTETSVANLKAEVQGYHEQLTRADGKLQTCMETPDAAAIEAVLNSVMGATEEYLESRNDAHGSFEELHRGQPGLDGVRADVRAAVEREDEQIKSTRDAIKGFDYENDLGDACRRVVSETGKLIDRNEQLQETLDKAMVKVAENDEPQPREVDPATRNHTPTETSSQADLEANPGEPREGEPREKAPDRDRQICVALVEIDDFTQLNERYGLNVGNKILRTVAQFLESENRGERTVSQMSEQRFRLQFPNAETRFATNVVERVRQMIEKVHFHYDDHDIRITVSCAVAEATSLDTSEALTARAEATLEEARRYGHNRTFLHDGKYSTPVVPPDFSLDEKRITI